MSSAAFGAVTLLDFGHFNRCAVVTHDCSNLCFPSWIFYFILLSEGVREKKLVLPLFKGISLAHKNIRNDVTLTKFLNEPVWL